VYSGLENESLPTACTPMLWPLCCRGCESGYKLQLQRLLLSVQATFSLQCTLYCCWSNNRKCKSHKKRDPMYYERYNRMSSLTTSVITRLQCNYIPDLAWMLHRRVLYAEIAAELYLLHYSSAITLLNFTTQHVVYTRNICAYIITF